MLPRLTQPMSDDCVPLLGKNCRSRYNIAEDVILMLDARIINHHADAKEEGKGRISHEQSEGSISMYR